MTKPFLSEFRLLQSKAAVLACLIAAAVPSGATSFPSTWPQPYGVQRDGSGGTLTFTTAYYTVQHDLKRGGAISLIRLTHGRASNLLSAPLESRLRALGEYSDLNDPHPRVRYVKDGLQEIVSLESRLMDEQGRELRGIKLKTRFEYHWGYIKVHKEFVFLGKPVDILELSPVITRLAPALSEYGYREGTTEQEGAPPFSFGSCRWGKLSSTNKVHTTFLPRYVMLADPGVEGLEWFAGSDLWQWDLQLAGKRGRGQFVLESGPERAGITFKISPVSGKEAIALTNSCAFDFYLGLPLLEGHAIRPWFHTSFNRNKGEWVSTDQVKRWAEAGMQTVHCHNDGDYYDDGLFWRDGSYPPYPDMDKYDKVIRDCHDLGMRVATYFSNKELHPSTKEYQQHGQEWGRKNLKGDLQHNFFRGTNEFGAQMCLRSGWLQFLEFSIDRVLTRHDLDGVYYDWNVALLCCNELHGPRGNAGSATHWDIDELLQLMEWTRRRVGPNGLVIVHNTTTPMFATENFANDVVANEWGYGKWTGDGPELKSLPLEWSLVGARARGVISYGQLDAKSPQRLHRVFALEALISGVTPWPASPETFALYPVLKPIGDIETSSFLDWRNEAVKVEGLRCASAIYSRPGECFILLANMKEQAQEVQCRVDPRKLPHPLSSPKSARLLREPAESVDVKALLNEGAKIQVPGDSAVLIHLR